MSLPKMNQVESSNILEVGYDSDNQTVFVRFRDSKLYCYKNVPEQEYQGLLNAPSVGSYLHRNFKNVYPYERVE